MSFLVLRDFDPIIVVHRHARTHIVGTTAMLGTVDRLLSEAADQGRKIALIYEVSDRRPLEGTARRVVSEWFRDPHGLLARSATSLDYVVPYALTRSALSAVFWLQKPPVPGEVHKIRCEAVSSAVASLKKAGFEPPPSIATHGDAPIAARIHDLLFRR